MIMSESEVFPKLTTDSESLTLSESCVRSDIANIIKKIYSPRPLDNCNKSIDSAVEPRDDIGDNVTISRPKEKEEKRFGFYFEPVTRNFAKTIVDSSTTSGSVSMPLVKYKPKRLRHVCECCKRKIPYRDHETRAKRACKDCRICKRNDCSDGGNYPATGDRREEEDCSGHCSKMKVSNCEIVRVHPGSSFKILEEIEPASINLERKRSSTNLLTKHSENVLKRNSTHGRLGCSSGLNLKVVPDLATDTEITKTQESTTHRAKNLRVRNVSLLQRVLSHLFGKGKTSNGLEEGEIPTSRKTENSRYTWKKSYNTSLGMEEETKQLRNNEVSENLEQTRLCVSTEDHKRASNHLPNEKVVISANMHSVETRLSGQKTIGEGNLGKIIVHSCPELAKNKSKQTIDKRSSIEDEDCRELPMCDKDVENGLSNNEQNERLSEKRRDKFQVAYEGLRIKKDTDWAYTFWGEVFGVCHSIVSFFIAFLLHLLTFVLQSLVQPLCFGTVRVSSDHFFKPCLSTAYESVIQPTCNLIERCASSLRDVCLPVAQCFGAYCKEVSHVCRACRIVEIHKNYHFGEEPINL